METSTSPTSDTGTTFPVYYTGGSDGHVRSSDFTGYERYFFHPEPIEKLIVESEVDFLLLVLVILRLELI